MLFSEDAVTLGLSVHSSTDVAACMLDRTLSTEQCFSNLLILHCIMVSPIPPSLLLFSSPKHPLTLLLLPIKFIFNAISHRPVSLNNYFSLLPSTPDTVTMLLLLLLMIIFKQRSSGGGGNDSTFT